MHVNHREVDLIYCQCSGRLHEVEPTDEELKEYNCSKPYPCCMTVIECDTCRKRIIFKLFAPEF